MTRLRKWEKRAFLAILGLVLLGFPLYAWANAPAKHYVGLLLALPIPLIGLGLAYGKNAKALWHPLLGLCRRRSLRVSVQAVWSRLLLRLSGSLRARFADLERTADVHARSSCNLQSQLEASLRRSAGLEERLAEAHKKLDTLLPDSVCRLIKEHRDFWVGQRDRFAACVQQFLPVFDVAAQGLATGEELFDRVQQLTDALGVALGEVKAEDQNGHLASRFPADPFEFFGTSDPDEIRSRYRKLAAFHPDKVAAFDAGGMPWQTELLEEFMKILNARKAEAI